MFQVLRLYLGYKPKYLKQRPSLSHQSIDLCTQHVSSELAVWGSALQFFKQVRKQHISFKNLAKQTFRN